MSNLYPIKLFKDFFGNSSFRRKLILIIFAHTFIILSLVTIALVVNELITKQNEIQQELKTYTEIVAQNAAAPILFNDQKAANEILKGFGDHKQIIAVYILDANNAVFASYKGESSPRGPSIKTPAQLLEGSGKKPWLFPLFLHRGSEYTLQIKDEGEIIGSVFIQADFRDFVQQTKSMSLIAVIVFISAMIFSYFMSRRFERIITQPLTSLAENMESVSRSQNFSIRADPPHYNDEVGSLIYGFNSMLAQIEQRDQQLETYKNSLEDKIIERTAELSTVNNQLQYSIKTIEEAKKVAEEANMAKTRFLANMSHEIRTPMNGIMGMTEILLQSGLSEKQTHYAKTVKNSTSSLLTIINDILDFSKIEAGKLELEIIPFCIKTLFAEIIENFAPLALNKQITLTTEYKGEIPAVLEGDPLRLRQVVNNLIANAIKFTNNGTIKLLATVSDDYNQNFMLTIMVQDSGIGIGEDVLPQIFDRFSQADNSTTRKFGGTGLGLAIVKQLVELMGGTVSVDSKPEHGSTFKLNIPLKPSAIPQTISAPCSQKDDTRLKLIGKKVLLVEDTAVNRDVCSEILTMLGCQIACAINGKIALELLTGEIFDIVLMDCQMPVMDGYECTSLFREWEQNNLLKAERTPVIALTGNAMQEDRQRCIESGMDDIILKPFQLQQFISCISLNLEKCSSPTNKIIASSSQIFSESKSGLNESNDIALNHEQLEQIRSLHQIGEESLLDKFVIRYLNDAPKLVEDIKSGWQSKNMETLTAAIHKLKTSSGMMGAEKLSQLCARTEVVLRIENRLPDDETIRELEKLSKHYNLLLKQEINV